MSELERPLNCDDEEDQEILRVWVGKDSSLHVSLVTVFEEQEAWGAVLADVVKHLGNAYESLGIDKEETISDIRQTFEIEIEDVDGEVQEVKLH